PTWSRRPTMRRGHSTRINDSRRSSSRTTCTGRYSATWLMHWRRAACCCTRRLRRVMKRLDGHRARASCCVPLSCWISCSAPRCGSSRSRTALSPGRARHLCSACARCAKAAVTCRARKWGPIICRHDTTCTANPLQLHF
ncbi:hypothetical protein DFQ30_001663, partial [Apophysomyces sp. BC1015]